MSTLEKFRKPGGFQELLLLVESSEPFKQNILLQLVGKEDPGWAYLLKLKAITFQRVLSWPQEVIMEITSPLPDHVLAAAYQLAEQLSQRDEPPLHEKWLQGLPSIKAKQILEMVHSQTSSAGEQSAAAIRVLQVVRDLESKGILRFSEFDPLLQIEEQLVA